MRNWAEYEAGLQKRGDLTVWLSDAALDAWCAPASGKPGGQPTFADIAIEAALTIRMVFHLLIDAPGSGSTSAIYEAVRASGEGRAVRVLIPPGRDAHLAPQPSAALEERNRNILSIRELGRREWRKRSGYSRGTMVENAVLRYKTIIGGGMRSRTLEGQRVEAQLGCRILNRLPVWGCLTATEWCDFRSGEGDLPSKPSHAPKPRSGRASGSRVGRRLWVAGRVAGRT